MDHQAQSKDLKKIYASIILFLCIVVAISVIVNPEFIDYYYMKATGDYLLKNGSFNVNPFTVNELGIVTQQWLYCIWISIVDNGGQIAVFSVVVMYLGLFLGSVILYTRLHKLDAYKAFTIFFVTVIVSGGYLLRIRPETLSIILLVLQLVIMEKAYNSKKVAYIYLLPVMMLIEINIHGSVWFIHFLVILAYTFPNLFKKYTIDNQLKTKEVNKHFYISFFLMISAMFINPYGYKMIAYTFLTMKNNVFSYINISETQKPDALSFMAVMVYVLVAIVVYGLLNKALRISSVYLAAGFSLMTLMMGRNLMFLILGYIVVLTDVLKFLFEERKIQIDFVVKARDILLFRMVVAAFAMIFIFTFYNEIIVKKWDTKFSFSKIVNYIDEHYEKDDHIYATNQVGSYFEYRGYNKIYTDSRPEIYLKAINGKKDVLKEYDRFGQGNLNKEDEIISSKEIEEYIDGYGFKCFVVSKYESTLYNYLSLSDEYELKLSEKGVCLFEKCK